MSPLVIGIIIAVILIIVAIIVLSNNKSNASSNTIEDEQKNTLSKILETSTNEKFRFQQPNYPQPLCFVSTNSDKEKNIIDEYLKLMTSDAFYNSLKKPLPNMRSYFTKLSNLWDKIKLENGANVNTTYFMNSFIITSVQFIWPIYAFNYVNENQSIIPLETLILILILLSNLRFMYNPNNTMKKGIVFYDKNTNKVSINDSVIKEILSKSGKSDYNTDDKINNYLEQTFGPKIVRDGATPSQWYSAMKPTFMAMSPNASNMSEEQKFQTLNNGFQEKNQFLNNVLNDSNYIKQFNTNIAQQNCTPQVFDI